MQAGMNLPGFGSGDYWTKANSAALLGLTPGTGSKAAGQSLPPTTTHGGDLMSVPWHPDSPIFWLAVLGVGTMLGITGASVRVRAFKGRAGVNVGES